MNITINQSILDKYELNLEEFLVLYLCSKEINFEEVVNKLISKGLADKNLYSEIQAVISNNTKELISSVLIESDKTVIDKEDEYRSIAAKMRDLYPDGKKPGTTYYWKDSVGIIAKRLMMLRARFGFQFTEEQALTATKEYIESFNGNYTYMQLLKYFIIKADQDGYRSEFMSLIENREQEDSTGTEWLEEVR